MKKTLTYVLTILAIGALSACDFGNSTAGTIIATEEANTTMMRTMANMTNMTEGSLDLTLTTDSTVSVDVDSDDNDYGYGDETVDVVVDGAINAKVSDLWGTAPKAALNVNLNEATVNATGTYDGSQEVYVDESFTDQQINAYYDNEYAYVDFSAATALHSELFGAMNSEEPMPTKFKGLVGTIAEFGIPDMTEPESQLPSSEVDEMIEQLLPVLEMMPNTSAMMFGNELRIVYQLTQADLPDLIEGFMIEIARSTKAEIPSSIDASLQAEIDAQVNEIMSQINLTTFRLELHIDSTRNIFSYFQVQLDGIITIQDSHYDGYWDEENSIWVEIEIPFEQIVDIDMTTTLELNAFSEPVTITFPTDLATYTDMSEDTVME